MFMEHNKLAMHYLKKVVETLKTLYYGLHETMVVKEMNAQLSNGQIVG